jgi:hypothetical protein
MYSSNPNTTKTSGSCMVDAISMANLRPSGNLLCCMADMERENDLSVRAALGFTSSGLREHDDPPSTQLLKEFPRNNR